MKQNSASTHLTHTTGAPVSDNLNIQTAGPRGPAGNQSKQPCWKKPGAIAPNSRQAYAGTPLRSVLLSRYGFPGWSIAGNRPAA
jgi:hypothetical protein